MRIEFSEEANIEGAINVFLQLKGYSFDFHMQEGFQYSGEVIDVGYDIDGEPTIWVEEYETDNVFVIHIAQIDRAVYC